MPEVDVVEAGHTFHPLAHVDGDGMEMMEIGWMSWHTFIQRQKWMWLRDIPLVGCLSALNHKDRNIYPIIYLTKRTGPYASLMEHDLASNPIYTDANAAREHLEKQRWPNGAVCPHCGSCDPKRVYALKGKAHRPGLYQCNDCLQQFTVTVGSVFERSKIPLNKWVLATHLLGSSKKGMSAHQLHRMLGVTYKTAWFMAHRIREAMRPDPASGPLGGEGKIVEADETYYGRAKEKRLLKPRTSPYTKGGWKDKGAARPIISLVERGGSVRSFYTGVADKATVTKIVKENIARETVLHTDESRLYGEASAHFADHLTVKHSAGEYVRGDVHTNTIEGFFSIFKRGMKGVYQHCAEKHLHRYLAEFDFRYNNRTALGVSDDQRRDRALSQIAGKRLTYRSPHSALV
jgi:transposase-like protein